MVGIKNLINLWMMKDWIKRIGIIGLLFFFVKGLVWLAIFYGLADMFW